MKKILNEKGVVTGLLPKAKLSAMKDACRNGGVAFIYDQYGWTRIIPEWTDGFVYKVEYEEKEMIPWDISDFEVGMVLKSRNTEWKTMIVCITESGSIHVGGGNSFSLAHILKRFTQKDRSKFEKEAI
jgi:hypothetical protein